MLQWIRSNAGQWARLKPKTGLARLALWLAALFLALWTLRWSPTWLAGLAEGLQILVGLVLTVVSIPLVWTLIRTKLLWSLRNKLILTYVLVGLAPVVLLATLVLVSAYVAAGQFSIHLVDTRMQAELSQMSAENATRLEQLAQMVDGRSMREAMSLALPPDDRMKGIDRLNRERARLRRETGTYVDGTAVFQMEGGRRGPLGLPPWATQLRGSEFHGMVEDGGELYLLAMQQKKLNDGRIFSVIDSLPVDATVVSAVAQGLGTLRLLPVRTREGESAAGGPAAGTEQKDGTRSHTRSQADIPEIRGGMDPRALNFADIRVRFPSTLPTMEWSQGRPDTVALVVDSRPSLLYEQLFGASLSGWVMTVIRVSLTLLLIVFAAIELTAFVMAVRLSRTMTESIADLYDATQRVDRGDLQHRVPIRRNDQLAELGRSFNVMTGSLQRLLGEQKEKQRLESELSIAQGVQANLFPHHACDLPTLELHGVCRPARSVSGDYYDFLAFQEDVPGENGGRSVRRDAGVGIAIGDISGKGISAALLMATLHSAVRAYQFASEELVYSGTMLEGLTSSKEGRADAGGWFRSPGKINALLNRHLYRSTTPEKYATLFLAHYDAASAVLTYSNAGQLPPFVLGRDGSVQRLEAGGTVVGLMDGMHFAEGVVRMQSGDILVAYSDGVTEPENDFGDFGETRLLEVVARYRTQPLHVISAQVMLALDAWIGAEEQPDDITLVLARQA